MEKRIAEYGSVRTSSILARQKSRDISKFQFYWRRLVLFVKWGLAGFLFLGVIGGCLLIRHFLMHSPRLSVSIKKIQGLHYVSESQVQLKLSELESRNRNLFCLDLDEIRRSIEQIPWVSEVVVYRTFPDKLTIEVKERRPIAFAKVDAATMLVDEEGVLLERNSEMKTQFDFPVIVGLEPGFDSEILARNRERLLLYQALIQSLDENGANLSKDLSEIYLQDPDNVAIILNDDTVLVYLGKTDFQEKFRHYLAMGKDLKQKYPKLDSVDLRFQNQVIVNSVPGEVAAGAESHRPGAGPTPLTPRRD
ncbi:MAG TPA: FtsQ-type POTRA domain-containing protein [Terriglobia bacterium]|nr:FtsQ-type POTRA domain-containing protein [Terriglobia bacterium]